MDSPQQHTGPGTGPTYEGRPLPRPEDEIVDQGAGFDVATLVTRRRLLGLAGVGVGAAALAACGGSSSRGSSSSASSSGSGTEIAEETNGPYPADGTEESLNVLSESGIVRRDITSSIGGGATVEGVPLTMAFVVNDMAKDSAFAGAAVYVWHCDGQGRYSMYTEGVEDETWLRGIQVADDDGKLSFTTIVPGCYTGRWPHLHFEIYPDADSADDVANVIATSQVALPETMLTKIYERDEYEGSTKNLDDVGSVEDDGIFADSVDQQMPTVRGSIADGYVATLTVNVDTTTKPTSGGEGGDGKPPSGGGGGRPPSGGKPPSSGKPPSGSASADMAP